MKAIPGLILYHQTYRVKWGQEVAYCPDCETTEVLVDDPNDEVNFAFCPDCHGTFYRDGLIWKEAEKDSENNPPADAEKYHAIFVVQQGGGHWANIKYRTYLNGTVDEIDRLQTLIRKLRPITAANLINILEKWLGE